MADKDYVISVLRATLQSCKGAVPLNQCNRDYKELEGDYIPFKKLGFSTLEEFLSGVPEIKIFRNSYGEVLVDAVATENTSHLAELVARQKSNTKKSAPRMNHYHQLRITKFDAPWRRQTPAYSSNTQFYKQYNPYRATTAYNNNSYNKNNYSKPYVNSKMPEPPRRLPSEARPAPTRRSPPPAPTPAPPAAAPAFITTAKSTQNSVAKSNSVVKPNSVVKSNPAPAPAKTPAEERKPSGLSLTARMQAAAALADEADNHSRQSPVTAPTPKPKLSKASSRLSNLRESLHSDLIPLPLPATDLHKPPLVDIVTPTPQLSPLPLNATAQEKLAWTCKKMSLPEPIYKINSMKDSKRGPTVYFCVVKVGNDHSARTYPNASPSEDSSREMAAASLQAELESLPSPVASAAALPALDGSLHLVTSSPAAAIAGLVDLVATHESGLWASTVPIRYREKYNENLPVNWQDLVENSTKFKTDRGVNGQLMILPNNNMMIDCSRVLTAGDWWLSHCSNLDACDIQHRSPVLSNLARLKCATKSWRTPAPRSALGEAGPVLELPELQLPNQSGWNVYITSVTSTVEVWLRLIGDEYSTEYESLQTAMKLYYENTYSLVTLVEINAWYAVELEEGWHRGLVVEVLDEESVLVFLGDHGDDEAVPISKLRVLAHQFTNLAPQAILCRLDKMEELGASEIAASIVRTHLVGEVLVAVPAPPPPDPAAPDDCFSVILFRTLETEDVNVNEQILKEICKLGELNLTEMPCWCCLPGHQSHGHHSLQESSPYVLQYQDH